MMMSQGLSRRLIAPVVLIVGLVAGLVAVTASPASAAVSCGYYSGTAEMVQGDSGAAVREIQCLLNKDIGSTLTVDGDFGSKTYSAVVRLQKEVNDLCVKQLTVDGRVGAHTWSALRAPGCPTV